MRALYAVAAVFLATAAGCQFDTSGRNSDSDSGAGEVIDAHPRDIDAAGATPDDAATSIDAADIDAAVCGDACAAAGGSCEPNGTCLIECDDSSGACDQVVCPPGIPCEVMCEAESCQGGIDCTEASECNITCRGAGACRNGEVTCGGSTCKVSCDAGDDAEACMRGVRCEAEVCDVSCLGDKSCRDGEITCGGATCALTCSAGEGAETCYSGARCDAADSCDISCLGDKTCRDGQVRCGGRDCEVSCDSGDGAEACAAGITCDATESCELHCCGSNTCSGGTSCTEASASCEEDSICTAGARAP